MKIYTLTIEPWVSGDPDEAPLHFLYTDEDDRDQRIKDVLNNWAALDDRDLDEAPDNLTGQALLDWFKTTAPADDTDRLHLEQWDTAEHKWVSIC